MPDWWGKLGLSQRGDRLGLALSACSSIDAPTKLEIRQARTGAARAQQETVTGMARKVPE